LIDYERSNSAFAAVLVANSRRKGCVLREFCLIRFNREGFDLGVYVQSELCPDTATFTRRMSARNTETCHVSWCWWKTTTSTANKAASKHSSVNQLQSQSIDQSITKFRTTPFTQSCKGAFNN